MRNFFFAALAAWAIFLVGGIPANAGANCDPVDMSCRAQVQRQVDRLSERYAAGPKREFNRKNCIEMRQLSRVWAPACRQVKAICRPYFNEHGELSEFCVEKCALCDVREGEVLRWARKCELAYGI